MLREAYLTESATTVVFVPVAVDLVTARKDLERLPLVSKGLFDVQLHELRPFGDWATLSTADGPAAR